MFTQLKKLIGHSLIYATGDVLNTGLTSLLIPLYTAYLTPADYGILAIASTLASILSVFYLQSLSSAFTRIYFDYLDINSRRNYGGTVWILMTGLALAAALLIELFGSSLSHLLFKDIPYIPYIRLVVWTTFIINSSLLLFPALLQVQEKPFLFITFNLVVLSVNATLIIYFVVVQKLGALGSLEGRFYGSLILAIPVTVLYLKQVNLHWSWPGAKASLQFALPLLPHLISLWLLNLSDRLILQKYVSLNDVGIYNLGYQFASILQLLAISLINAPGFFFYKTADQPDGAKVLGRVSTYYWLVIIFLGMALTILAKEVLVLITYRPEYHIAYQVVPWITLGVIMRAFYFIFSTVLYYTKQVKVLASVTVISGMLNIGLNLLLVPRYGYMAAAINTFIAYAVQAVVIYFIAQRAYSLPFEYIRIVKMSTIGFGLFLVTIALPEFSLWIEIVVKMIVLITYPIWLTVAGFWTTDETQLLRRGIQHLVVNLQQYRLLIRPRS